MNTLTGLQNNPIGYQLFPPQAAAGTMHWQALLQLYRRSRVKSILDVFLLVQAKHGSPQALYSTLRTPLKCLLKVALTCYVHLEWNVLYASFFVSSI